MKLDKSATPEDLAEPGSADSRNSFIFPVQTHSLFLPRTFGNIMGLQGNLLLLRFLKCAEYFDLTDNYQIRGETNSW